ncbi:MAG TPA: helix-hairpin-helix domain-containing protein [Streptosporangiaceae bacterium]
MTYAQFLPQPTGQQPPPSALRRRLSYVWAVLPFVTIGLGTPFVMAYAAVRLRSGRQWMATGLYAALLVLMFVTAGLPEDSAGPTLAVVFLLLLMLAGTVHALVIRSRVVQPAGRNAFDAAVDVAKERRAARDRARELAAGDPTLARELHIGRPDLPRSFDDGGLIDVNTAPPAVLAGLPGMTPALVDQIVRARAETGAFISVEELSVAAELPPALTDQIGEYAIFLS